MGRIRFGPSGLPVEGEPEAAIAEVAAAGYDACEVGFVGGFRMEYPEAERLGAAAKAHDVAISIHAPLAGFMGHVELGKKYRMAVGMLDHSAGLAAACGAEVVVFHPGYLLGRERQGALDAVVEQLSLLGERLEGKGRLVPFGVEVMGRVRELGSLDDVLEIARRVPFVRPVIDFAHMHATSDGAFTGVEAFAEALGAADEVIDPGGPFHIHFSDIAFANRNETRHLPYGEGTLRAEPLAEALARFERPATVISEAPDVASTQAIGAVLRAGTSSASRSS
ncbi:MAG: TIM barrel protein [Actinobacteria bacterium]|nr:TIM barrel protein [Actinomycetota bacterium]